MENNSDPNSKNENAEQENQQPRNEAQKMIFISPMIINEEKETDNEEMGDEEDDYDAGDEYGSSGEKYGWYHGYSDDAIDDAFEGDPENTWNVD